MASIRMTSGLFQSTSCQKRNPGSSLPAIIGSNITCEHPFSELNFCQNLLKTCHTCIHCLWDSESFGKQADLHRSVSKMQCIHRNHVQFKKISNPPEGISSSFGLEPFVHQGGRKSLHSLWVAPAISNRLKMQLQKCEHNFQACTVNVCRLHCIW